jgi:arylsulfatase A-like enzyme/Tfp pilus assembly protein PilF
MFTKLTMTTKSSWALLREDRSLWALRAGRRVAVLWLLTSGGCAAPAPPPATPAEARHLVLVTIDTLRADRVGAYGYARARTPHIDGLSARGVRFDRAYATAPVTLPSHASLMTGRYPPGHGARHNGIRVDSAVPSLAKTLAAAGFATGAFVTAFPLDRRFGLNAGFTTYSDRMPRGARGRPDNERPGREAVNEALAWLATNRAGASRLFLWVHLFEPHAPYGRPSADRSVADRYDDEIAESDVQVGRILEALGPDAASTIVVVASDHGEAFGEHGEISHSLFVYDTTLRVPLVIAGPGVPARVVSSPVSLIDVVPTVLPLLKLAPFDSDGIDLSRTFAGADLARRDLYAESFAPLLDFGWSPLRSIRSGGFKYIDAPRAELYETTRDPEEAQDLSTIDGPRVAELRDRVGFYSGAALDVDSRQPVDREALGRLQALGYASGSSRPPGGARPDPKDRREIAARLSEIGSGELQGPPLEAALRRVLADDPRNPQANLRLGYVLLESNRCAAAVPFLKSAIAAKVPTADAHLGLGLCQTSARQLDAAAATLRAAEAVEPGNPVVLANLGIVLSDGGHHQEAIDALQRALALDPDFHEARFNLARVFARASQRADAAREAQELLTRLPANAPQRAEVQRLLDTLR